MRFNVVLSTRSESRSQATNLVSRVWLPWSAAELGTPIMGFIPTSRLYQSGATIDAPPAADMLVEVELALTLPVGWTDDPRAEPSARLAFEIVRSRFARRDAIDLPSFVSDASGFHALVVGDAIPFDRLHWFLAAGASLQLEGKVVAEAVVGHERPDPLDVLAQFRTLALMFGMPVAPKMVISTGSLIVPFEARGAGEFEGRLASSAVQFTMRRTP